MPIFGAGRAQFRGALYAQANIWIGLPNRLLRSPRHPLATGAVAAAISRDSRYLAWQRRAIQSPTVKLKVGIFLRDSKKLSGKSQRKPSQSEANFRIIVRREFAAKDIFCEIDGSNFDPEFSGQTLGSSAAKMATSENDDREFESLEGAWWILSSPEQRELYQRTESDSRRHSLRIDMALTASDRLAAGEYEAWGLWVCGNAPPIFQKIDRALFRTTTLYEGQIEIEVGNGKYDRVVIRRTESGARQSDFPTGATIPQTNVLNKSPPHRPMKRGAKPKYEYTAAVFDAWHQEDAEALKKPVNAIYLEYQKRFRGRHPGLAPVTERSLHEYLKRWRRENGIDAG